MSRSTVPAACLLVTLSWLAPADVRADEVGTGGPLSMLQPVETGRYEPPSDDVLTGVSAEQDWQRRRGWRYGKQNIFPLTRGLEEAGVPQAGRWVLMPFTAAFDVGHALLGAVGGLYGD